VPLGEPTLVGGMSHIAPADVVATDAGVPANAAANAETPQLYLILEVR
jgi:hypothetical protein